MNEGMNPVDPMSAGSPGDPIGPVNPQGPVGPGPINPQGPMYEESTNYSRIYQIALGVLGFFLLIAIIFIIVYAKKAGRTQEYIDQKVAEGKDSKGQEVRDACEIEKKDIRENPWTNFSAREDFGSFKFTVPRNWSQYEYFDINANNPYSLYFNPEIVRYDSGQKKNHASLEVTISKKLYDAEIKEVQEEIKRNKDADKTEEAVDISNFKGTKLTYKDKNLGKRVGVIVLPYRDRALFIRTDDYDQWNEKYYDRFWKSFALTP